MRLFAIFIFCFEICAGLRVAETDCSGGKCSSVSQEKTSGPAAPDQNEPRDQYACCACGGATYDITFIGKWSKVTYPRHFPGRMASWSRLIGSSHSKDYIVWQYGGMASPGVTSVSEWGAVERLEKEMKDQGEKVFRIIKTRMPLYTGEGQVSTTFKADSRRNLVSAVAKLFPSPDWNVGIDRINLCDGNCTWRRSVVKDLYPWDAGTDDGITFTSANSKSVPQQPIRNITTTTHPRGSFPKKDGSDITRPFGQIKLQLMQTFGECGNPAPLPFPERPPRIHCKFSRWSSWKPCSVTCGRGVQLRGRAVIKREMNDGIACPHLLESRPCIQPNCPVTVDPTVNTPKPANCKLSPWSSWSGCRGVCHKGGRFRSRTILQKAEPGGKSCPDMNSLIKVRRCRLPKCPPEKANDCIVTGWSPWTPCSKKCNRGRKFRVRKIIKSEKNDGASCPTKLKERRRCTPVKCPA